jgi:hypothetical protein
MQMIEMLKQAEACDAMADKAIYPNVAYALRVAANQWRDLAVQMDLLERAQSYRMIRARAEQEDQGGNSA